MTDHEFIHRSTIAAPAREVFDWHLRPGAFERLTPPWEDVRLVSPAATIAEGERAKLSVPVLGPIRQTWVAEHRHIVPGESFQDVQLSGPFAKWEHTHRVIPQGPETCVLEDQIRYRLPLGWLGQLGQFHVKSKLRRMFAYRHAVTAADVATRYQFDKTGRTMRIAISGSTGLVGSALIPLLTTAGHDVVRLVRGTPSAGEIYWKPSAGEIDAASLEGIDAVVHLAGEGIATRRWSAAQKQRILDSRVHGTQLLSRTLAQLQRPPRVLVSASAIGYYGNRGDEVLTETSAPGQGFLADVCLAWENATRAAEETGIRTVQTRFGIILSPKGGALTKMLTPFRMGVGGRLGSGNQYMSWIALDDVIGAIEFALNTESLQGPVNFTAPDPVTNSEFTRVLGRVLSRPTLFPAPAFALKLILGEMADELLLASARVQPQKLQQAGYQFRFIDLAAALRHLLGK